MRKPPVLRFVLSSFFVFLFGLADRFFDSFGQLALETGNATAQGRPSGRVGWRVWTAAWPSTAKGSSRPAPDMSTIQFSRIRRCFWENCLVITSLRTSRGNCFKISRILINSLVCLDWGVWAFGVLVVSFPYCFHQLFVCSGAFDLSLDVLLSAW